MSESFIEHLIDRTLGSAPPIAIKHALRPDTLWHSYSQQSNENVMRDEQADMNNDEDNNSINKNNKNSSKNKIETAVIPNQDRIINEGEEDVDQSEKSGDIRINGSHQVPKPEPQTAHNIARKKKNNTTNTPTFYPAFSYMPKSVGGIQEKIDDESKTYSNRSGPFLANHDESRRTGSGQVKKNVPAVEGLDAPRGVNNGTYNASSVHVREGELHEDARVSEKRLSGKGEGDIVIISPSTDTFDKENAKLHTIKDKLHDDNLRKIASSSSVVATTTAVSTTEIGAKGVSHRQPLQPSHSAKKETLPITKASNDISVTISIGRIEVKAITSQMQQPSLAPKKAFGLSLQDYIKLRDEGQL